MKRRNIIIAVSVLIIAAVIIALISIFGGDYSSEVYTGDLYFLNDSATAIVAENREIKYHDTADLAEDVIKALKKGPEVARHQRIIDRDTHLISLSGIETGDVLVNFSSEFQTGDSQKDILAVYAVVKSLCGIDNINSVKIIIEGKDIVAGDGYVIDYLTDQDINLPTDTTSSEMREITLYFPSKTDYVLRREIRSVRVNDQQPLAQYIINELIKGPLDEYSAEALDKNTVLLSVETSENICFVNFNSGFLDRNSGSAEKEKMVIFSIVDSLTELEAIERVQFLMDGKRVDSFGNINIGSMFGRDESIIEQ